MSILVSVTLAQFLIVIIAILNYSLSKRLKTIVSRVYKQPNQFYYFKFIFFYVLLLIRRLKFLLNGKERYFPVNKLEKLQPLSIHENVIIKFLSWNTVLIQFYRHLMLFSFKR